jgi:hypothetical protein
MRTAASEVKGVDTPARTRHRFSTATGSIRDVRQAGTSVASTATVDGTAPTRDKTSARAE